MRVGTFAGAGGTMDRHVAATLADGHGRTDDDDSLDDDLGAAIARANAAREATRAEYRRLEDAMRRREATRARLLRDALTSAPTLAEELESRGLLRNDAEMAKLAAQMMMASPDEPDDGVSDGDASNEDGGVRPPGLSRGPRLDAENDATAAAAAAAAANANDGGDPGMEGADDPTRLGSPRRLRAAADASVGVLRDLKVDRTGQLAAAEGQLAARRRALEARQRDLARERDRLAERAMRQREEASERRKAEAAAAAAQLAASVAREEKIDADRRGGKGETSGDDRTSRGGGSDGDGDGDDAFSEEEEKEKEEEEDEEEEEKKADPRDDGAAIENEGEGGPPGAASSRPPSPPHEPSPFTLPPRPPDAPPEDRAAMVARLRRELALTTAPSNASGIAPSDRLLRMKIAHGRLAARRRYLDREEGAGGTHPPEAAKRRSTPPSLVTMAVRRMCRELAEEIVDAAATACASRPDARVVAEEREAWTRAGAARRAAVCRQVCDAVVREVTREAAREVAEELEAAAAAAASLVARAAAAAVIDRLGGHAAAAWGEPGGRAGDEGRAGRTKRRGRYFSLPSFGLGRFYRRKKTPNAEAAAAREAEEDDPERGGFGEALTRAGDDDDDSSSEEEGYASKTTRTDRRAVASMLFEMQRRRPPGLVYRHTQPLRQASPPPGARRAAQAAAQAAGLALRDHSDDSDASDASSDDSEVSTRSDSDDSSNDESAAAAVADRHPPPRTGVASLGTLAEPPPPSHEHRAAAVVERAYWGRVGLEEALGGGNAKHPALALKKGAVTSLCAAPGRALTVAAGTSEGEIVVVRFPGDGDAEEGGGQGGGDAVVSARGVCAPHPDAEKPGKAPAKGEEADAAKEAGPASRDSAVIAVGWSADGLQLATAERGGVSRIWTVGATAGAGGGKKDKKGGGGRKGEAGGAAEMEAALVLAPANHSSSSPLADGSDPAVGPGGDGSYPTGGPAASKGTSGPKTKMQAAAAAAAAADRWSHDARPSSSFFPAFTMGGRQPYAMFTRPNGDIVRASPSVDPAAIGDATDGGFGLGGAARGRWAQEVRMFRGARWWATGNPLGTVQAARRAGRSIGGRPTPPGGFDGGSSDEEGERLMSGTDDNDVDDGTSMEPAELFAALAGSDVVVGVDAVLDVAETIAAGAGGFLGRAEKRLLNAPRVPPVHPPNVAKKRTADQPEAYTQDLFRGHSSPVVFLDTLPDSASMMSIDAEGTVCLWSAYQGGRGRSGFGWFSPLGSWKLPSEVTAQIPAGPRVQLVPALDPKGKKAKDGGSALGGEEEGGLDPGGRADRNVSATHAPWMVSYGAADLGGAGKNAKKGSAAAVRTVVEIPKDHDWMEADRQAADAAPLASPRSDAFSDDDAVELLGAASGDLGASSGLDGFRSGRLGRRSGVVIPPRETRDYFISSYDESGALVARHRQRYVTRRAAAEVVGATICAESGQPDLLVIRRVSGLHAAAVKAGGVDAAAGAVPYFTAHCYSLDTMTPTVPRMDLPNPFGPPAWKAKAKAKGKAKGKMGGAAGVEAEAAEAAKGWRDPSPYPFVLAGATPSLGSEHLIVPVGAAHVGIFSLATGLMAHDMPLPGIPEGERLAVMTLMANPNPTGGVGVAGSNPGRSVDRVMIRSLLVVATAGGKEGGKVIRVYALNEAAAQIVRVDAVRAEVARSLPPAEEGGTSDDEEDEEDEGDDDDVDAGSEGDGRDEKETAGSDGEDVAAPPAP